MMRIRPTMTHRILLLSFTLILTLVCTLAQTAGADDQRRVQRIVAEEAVENGTVPVSLALAVARVESNFDPRAHSHAGARGVMQIMPATARGEFGVRAKELWHPRTNARLGVRYLAKLYYHYGHRWDLALSHYNGGGLKRDRRGSWIPHSYTRSYVSNVLQHSRRYERDVSMAALARTARNIDEIESGLGSENAETETAYWMYGEPSTDRDWRDYLKSADHWLKRVEPGQKAARDEPSYWDVLQETGGEVSRDNGLSRSEALEERISETRRRFRESLTRDGDHRQS
jgi:hypothetical protein